MTEQELRVTALNDQAWEAAKGWYDTILHLAETLEPNDRESGAIAFCLNLVASEVCFRQAQAITHSEDN